MDASKYGPNQYKNNKIKTVEYTSETRLDAYNRSTYEPTSTVSGESNQLGFFIDPQDSKNKDILRYIGKNGIMELIGNPSNLYSDKYYDLINKNYEYNTNGNKKTYFNELLTVYKFYFDKSIFSAIKNVIPARTNAYAGVVIEPTLLERPKYQNRPITTNISIDYQPETSSVARIKNIYKFSESLLWANFNTNFSLINSGSPSLQMSMSNSLPPNYQTVLDLTYLEDPVRSWPVNINNGYIKDLPDDIQYGYYPDFENYYRLWDTSSAYSLNITSLPIYGSVSHTSGLKNGTNSRRLLIGPNEPVNFSNVYSSDSPQGYFPGYNTGSHQILYYMLKVWERQYYYTKTGEYVRSTNPNGTPHSTYNFEYNGSYYYTKDSNGNIITRIDDPSTNEYDSASYYLYKYVIVNESYMRNLIYFTDEIYEPQYNPLDVSSGVINTNVYGYNGLTYGAYTHKVNTFINTPDNMVSNISAPISSISNYQLPIPIVNLGIKPGSYFELVRGYPINHYSHKMKQFSKTKYGAFNNVLFIKGQNSDNDAITNTNTNNSTIIYTNPTIQTVVSPSTGQITPPNSLSPIS